MVNPYYFGKNSFVGFRDRVEYIKFKIPKLMKIDTFSKRGILDKIVYFKEWKLKKISKDIILTNKGMYVDFN